MIGVLALQGGVREHIGALLKLGVETREVRAPEQMEGLKALIIPGGESTTLRKLMDEFGLKERIIEQHKNGMALFGTCAGAIVLSKEIEGEKGFIPALEITAKRNSYGRQLESFETMLKIPTLTGVAVSFRA